MTDKALKEDLVGKVFGKLKVIKYSHINDKHRFYWECLCECGNSKIIARASLLRKNKPSRSCGCIVKDNSITHNMSYGRLYNIWTNMKQRCYNPNNTSYHNYGGRGIYICDSWKSDFKIFYDWSMNNGYDDTLTIDRVDNDRGYEPNNCKWATRKEQSNNTRYNDGWYKSKK